MDYQSVLKRFTYNDGQTIFDRISKADISDFQENRDIINEIVLWKINRTPKIDSDTISMIGNLSSIATPIAASISQLTFDVLTNLLNSKGIHLPIASTILHFYYPDIYPIIDQRAYRELYKKEYPKYGVKEEKLTQLYMQYIADCYSYQQEKCPDIPFSKIDKVLYQLDKDKGYNVIY